MQFTSDPRYNIAYIRFRDKGEGVESVPVGDDLGVDVAPDGPVYGIELLNANEQLQWGGEGVTIINEATGERAEITLATD